MPPLLIAALQVSCLFAVFWFTRVLPAGRRWRLRLAAILILFFVASALAEDARAAAVVGEYSAYLVVPAVVIYWIVRKAREG